jgi:cellobiose phosphorylase
MKPGWNVKFQKSGQAFGTLYPEKNTFSVFIVIAYRLEGVMQTVKHQLSDAMRERYEAAGDFMKMGKWMMFQVKSKKDLDDYKLLVSVKMAPKA